MSPRCRKFCKKHATVLVTKCKNHSDLEPKIQSIKASLKRVKTDCLLLVRLLIPLATRQHLTAINKIIPAHVKFN